jgi:hypothetical protein
MTVYRDMIMEDCGCDAERADEIEETMRVESPTLNHLTRDEFRKLAKVAARATPYSNLERPEAWRRERAA